MFIRGCIFDYRPEVGLYPPMPPLILSEEPDGRSPRVVAVGILPRNSADQHEIVGVNLNTGQIHRYSGRARGPFRDAIDSSEAQREGTP